MGLLDRSAHIINWNFASDDWHSPKAENDLHAGGRFVYRKEAKDGSFGFDFSGSYDLVEEAVLIEYTMDDDRKAIIKFIAENDMTRIVESFQAEQTNSLELQRNGRQTIQYPTIPAICRCIYSSVSVPQCPIPLHANSKLYALNLSPNGTLAILSQLTPQFVV